MEQTYWEQLASELSNQTSIKDEIIKKQQQEIETLKECVKNATNDVLTQGDEIEHLRDMLKRSRNHSRDRRKEVKILQNSNRNHKQEIERLKADNTFLWQRR